jgi:hypothetical protein
MYLVPLKTLLTEALKRTFDSEYVNADFRDLHASIEFPMEPQHYPGIWVDYNPVGNLQIAGIDHIEYAEPSPGGLSRRYTRWKFQGEASFTLVALSSLERDRLHDELVRVMAFGSEQDQTSEFRSYIEDNEFLAVNFDFDEISARSFASSLGTPWQTDDMIYEAEIAMECFGEFVSDGQTQTLVPLSAVQVIPRVLGEADTTDPGGWI